MIAALEDTLEQLSLLSCIPAAADPSFLSQIDDLGLTDTVKQLWQIEESLRLTVSDHYSEAIDDDPGSDIILGRLNTTTHSYAGISKSETTRVGRRLRPRKKIVPYSVFNSQNALSRVFGNQSNKIK